MASDDQLKNIIVQVKGGLAEICGTRPEDFVREGELGKVLNFGPALPYIRRVIELFGALQGNELEKVGYSTLQQILVQAQAAGDVLRRIKSFSPRPTGSFSGDWQQLVNQIRDGYDNWFSQVAPTVAYLAASRGDITQSAGEARNQLAEITNLRQNASERQKEIVGILDSAKQTIREIGIAEHAKQFGNQADRHNEAAWYWLGSALLLSLVAGLFGWYKFSHIPEATTPGAGIAHYVAYGVPRAIVLSLLLYGIFLCVKNYVAHEHNAVINRHRENSLQTFEAFVKSAADQGTKDAVLIQATRCIFEPQPTGYSSSEVQPPIPSAMVQVLREAANKNG